MAKEIDQGMLVPGKAPSWSLEALLPNRLVVAAAVSAGVFGLLLFVLLAHPLGYLPAYPAVILAFAIAIALPGLLLQRALLSDSHTDALVRLTVSPALGLALIAVPGFISLELHTSLQQFSVFYAIFAAVTCGVAALLWRASGVEAEEEERSRSRPLLLVLLLAIAIGGIASTPFWAKGRLSSDYDDWTYMSYVRSYTDTDRMNSQEPFLGTRQDVTPRMRDNIWVLSEALVSKTAQVPPEEVLLEYLRPVLALLVLAATYSFTQTLFRKRTASILAVAFLLGYAFLDLAPHEGFGVNLFLRITEDKMIAAFYLLPVAFLFLARFITRPKLASYAGFCAVVLGLSFVHPVPLAFIASGTGMLALLRVGLERRFGEVRTFGMLLAPIALASLWPFVQRQLLVHVASDLFSTKESAITFRNQYHVVELGKGLLMGNYHMIINPLMLTAIAFAPLVFLASRRSLGNQLLVAMTAGALLVFVVPVFATPVSKAMTPQTLWKMPWMIPVAPILGYLAAEATSRLARWRPIAGGGLGFELAAAFAPVVVVIAVLVTALLVQEQYARADGKGFYNSTSNSSLYGGMPKSVFLGGIDRAFGSTWRQSSESKALFAYMQDNLPRGSIVLAEPTWVNHMMPGVLTQIYPVDFGGTAGQGQRRDDVNAYIGGQLSASFEMNQVFDRWHVDYVVAQEVHITNEYLQNNPQTEWVAATGPFEIYRVVR